MYRYLTSHYRKNKTLLTESSQNLKHMERENLLESSTICTLHDADKISAKRKWDNTEYLGARDPSLGILDKSSEEIEHSRRVLSSWEEELE